MSELVIIKNNRSLRIGEEDCKDFVRWLETKLTTDESALENPRKIGIRLCDFLKENPKDTH